MSWGETSPNECKLSGLLQESERMLKLIYDGSSDAIYLAQIEPHEQFRFVSVNETFLTISGYTKEQAEGRLMEEIVPPASHALVRAKYREVIETRGPLVYHEVADHPAGRRHGEITLMPITSTTAATSRTYLPR